MGKHAVLSASGSHRWLNCSPSARLELEFENTSSEAAKEGTAAHALCEHKLKKALKKRSRRPTSEYDSDEMEECTDGYVQFVMEQYEAAKQICTDPIILIEQHLDFSAMYRMASVRETASSFLTILSTSSTSNTDSVFWWMRWTIRR